MGNGENGEFTFLDILSVLSFMIGLKNLDMNATQEDAQRIQHELATKTELLSKEIHRHLEEQDKKIDEIIERLNQNDS